MKDTILQLDQLIESPLLKGELLWQRPSGGELRIGNAGEFVELSIAEKLSVKNNEFRVNIVVNEERVQEVTDLFSALKSCTEESKKFKIRNQILRSFFKSFSGASDSSSLDYIFISHRSFYQLPKEYENQFIEKNILNFKKSTLIASLVTQLALVCGYLDYLFIKEVFNSILLSYYYQNCHCDGVVNPKLEEDLS